MSIFALILLLFLSNIYLKMKMLWISVIILKKGIKKPPSGGLNYCLFASKHSLQYTGLAFVGLNGTWVSLPQSAHTVSYITTSLL